MKALEFTEANMKIAENQDKYNTLPAFYNIVEGSVLACFEVTDEDLKQIKKTGKIWYKQLTFGKSLQPMQLSTNYDELQTLDEDGLLGIGYEPTPDGHEISHSDYAYFEFSGKMYYVARSKTKQGEAENG
jgi:hypothetical protein